MGWTRENPGAGDGDSIHAAGVMRAQLAQQLIGHTRGYLDRADQTLATMSADTITAVRGVVDSVRPDVQQLAEQLQAHADALEQYAVEVDQIRYEATILARDEDDARATLRRAHGSLDDLNIWFAPSPATSPAMLLAQEDERSTLSGRVTGAEEGLAALERRRDALVERRRTADQICVYRLSNAPGNLNALSRASTATVTDGASLVALLSGMSAAQVAAYLTAHPLQLRYLRDLTPEQANTFWQAVGNPDGTRSASQFALVAAAPAVIGNLGGISYWARDLANRHQLTRAIGQARKDDDLVRIQALDAIQVALAPRDGVPRQLTGFINNEKPLAAVSIGDLDAAETVTYDVPGMNTAAKDIPGWARAAQNLHFEQGLVGSSGARAVVAWIGYETPPVPFDGNLDFGVARGEYARAGAERFIDELAGYNAARQDRAVDLNVVAHSYGTTTVTVALSSTNLDVDVLVMLGSAGIEPSIDNVEDLHVRQVYAGQAQEVIPVIEAGKGDEWAGIGRDLGARTNPIDPDFGSIVFGVDGEAGDPNMRPVTAHDPLMPLGTETGAGYLDRKTESIRNVALATTGRGDDVTGYVEPELTPIERGFLTPGRGYGYYDGAMKDDN